MTQVNHVEKRVVRDENGRISRVEEHSWLEAPHNYTTHARAVIDEGTSKRDAQHARDAAVAAIAARPRGGTLRMSSGEGKLEAKTHTEPATTSGAPRSDGLLDLRDLGDPSDIDPSRFDPKAADRAGTIVATFATLGVVDSDGDVIVPTAITDGIEVLFGSWNHSSVTGSVLPIGRGRIVNDGRTAKIHATVFDTPDARAELATIKALGPICQYSFAFRVLDFSTDHKELEQFPGARRILKSLDVYEVSAVYAGAGVDTGTVSTGKAITLASLGIAPEWLADIQKVGMIRLADLGFAAPTAHVTGSQFIDLRTL